MSVTVHATFLCRCTLRNNLAVQKPLNACHCISHCLIKSFTKPETSNPSSTSESPETFLPVEARMKEIPSPRSIGRLGNREDELILLRMSYDGVCNAFFRHSQRSSGQSSAPKGPFYENHILIPARHGRVNQGDQMTSLQVCPVDTPGPL